MVAQPTTDVDKWTGQLSLRLGKQWTSFEQFRTEGTVGIRSAIREGAIGTIRIGDTDFVLLRHIDFNRLLGMAREVGRLSRGVLLLRQAAEMVLRRPTEELNVRHLMDLTMEFTLPTAPSATMGDLRIEPSEADEEATGDVDPETLESPRALRPRVTITPDASS